jgi:hypothetical protein
VPLLISKERLKPLLIEGRRLNSQEYFKHCRMNHIKTFYFFCKKLCSQPENTALSSTVLNDYILSELKRRSITVSNKFNPQGWFGQAWTDWKDSSKNERLFKNEYYDVLLRTGEEPYSYQIKQECFALVQEIFAEFGGRV